MGRVSRPGPLRGGPGPERIREVVDSLVKDENRKQAYLAFAQELMFAERRSARRDSSEVRMQKPECRMAGYTPEPVKRVVMKWFRRGLSGHLLWLIGKELIPEPEVFHG